jgi:hypothetical protein
MLAIITEGIVRAVREWMPDLDPTDAEFMRRLVLEADPEKLWRCRLYLWPDGSARLVRDVEVYGKQLDADTAGAEEVILLRLVQQARDAVELPTTEPAGRGPLAHYLYP